MGNGMKLRIDGQSPVGLRLAYRFWIELGRPAKFRNAGTLNAWAPKIESLWRRSGLGYPEFKWFLIWALRKAEPDGTNYGNDFTARNLRAARDPMASLEKQFGMTLYEVFMPRANKIMPLLVSVREREDREAELAAQAAKPSRWVELLPQDAERWQIEQARHMDALDAAFPMTGPMLGETVEEWVMRLTAPLRNPDWRCPNCVYGVSLDGEEDVRIKWCADCEEERRMDEDDDKEWMCNEALDVSPLTKEWDGSEFVPQIINVEVLPNDECN
jgi:hypothetical protein